MASKTTKEWAYQWIENPHAFRHDTWMPAFFQQSNNGDPSSLARTQQEIHAMVHYLFQKSREYSMTPMRVKGDAAKGAELVSSIGCLACHQIQPEAVDTPTTRDVLRRQQGPNLIGLGSKTSKEWIYNWLKDPQRYHPQTRMPDLRLSDQEAADVAEYLTLDRNDEFEDRPVPLINKEIVDTIVFDFLTRSQTHDQAKTELASMDLNAKLFFAGEKLIGQYGCFGCHNIPGFENRKPIGAELTEEGEKSIHNLDFGFIHIDHTKYAWFDQKLRDPRIFDDGKVKAHNEKLVMPNFYLRDEEVEAIVTAILGFVNTERVKTKIKPRTPENLHIEEGQKIVREFNCQACHTITGEGGTIKPTIHDWLVKYGKYSQAEADKYVDNFNPPNLQGVGAKVNPEWLFNFLHQPTEKIRPWLKVRMPTFKFNTAHLNALVKYFNALDNAEFPFEEEVDLSLTSQEYPVAEKLFSKEYFDCQQCHVVGGQIPEGTPDKWAPDLARVKAKIRPKWLIEWIKDPQKIMAGTKMPTFF